MKKPPMTLSSKKSTSKLISKKSVPKKSTPKKSAKSGSIGSTQRQLKVRVKTAHKRSDSSNRWLERHLNDPYVAAARASGYRSRAAFKLIEIDDKYRILKPGQTVLDLGAAPGGWSQIAAERTRADMPTASKRGQVVAIDYLEFGALAGVEILQMDFMDEGAPGKLRALLRDRHADVVLSDMAAPTTGHTRTDHIRIMGLAEAAIAFSCEVLTPGGAFLSKVFQGGTEGELLALLKKDFTTVRHIKPPASRAESAELYVLATGFRG